METNTTSRAGVTYTPAEIEGSIASWTRVRTNATQTIDYLNQGNCFLIKRDWFDQWSGENPTFIHAYPSIYEGITKFTLIDNVSDSKLDIDYSFVHVADYVYGAPLRTTNGGVGDPTDITVLAGLERAFRWQMNKNNWVKQQVETVDGIFQAFHIPITDLIALFDDKSVENLYVVIGLKADGVADLILWNNVETFDGSSVQVKDVALPVPPFNALFPEENYQLLVQSEE